MLGRDGCFQGAKQRKLALLIALLLALSLGPGCEPEVTMRENVVATSCGLSASPLSLSTAVACSAPGAAGASGSNPCDPGCRLFNEQPGGPLTAEVGYSWNTGRPSQLSAEVYAAGFGECETGADCQFNSRCESPQAGTCSHSVCTEGIGLVDGCSECAETVCAADANCCASQPTTGCFHDPCQVGIAMDDSCDPCVNAICGDPATSHCCGPGGQWDQSCVEAVGTVCGLSCGCRAGEVDINGRCYLLSDSERSWERASLDCRRRGAGWELLSVQDSAENNSIRAIAGDQRWIGLFDAGSGPSGPAGIISATASSEKPGNGPGFALDGDSATSWSAESPLVSNVTVTANDSQSGRSPIDTIDGDVDSYWAAESVDSSDPKFITLQLDTTVSLEDVSIRWKNGHVRAFDFEIEAGPDVATLATVYPRGWSSVLPSEGFETYDVADTPVQVIRITAYGNSISGWNSIEEISLGSTPSTTFSFSVLPQTITFELAGSFLVEEVGLEWDNDDTQFEIWVGEELHGLALTYAGDNGLSHSLEDYDITDTQGRFVQVRAFGNSASRWNNLEEAEIVLDSLSSGSWRWSSGDPGTTWDESSMSGGYANWWGSEPVGGQCAALQSNGTWTAENCAEQNQYICEGPREHMSATLGNWDADCVAQAESLCHVRCDAADPDDELGVCVTWEPGQTDTSCPDVDLAVGVPCDGVIPVCNHGTTDAPAGIDIVHFDPGAQSFGAESADPSEPSAVTCVTSHAIPAGQCIELTGCVGGGTGIREVMVNPEGTVPECSTVDNWAIYDESIACDVPSCGGSTTSSERPKVDIIIFVDNSSSMEDEIDAIEANLNTDFAEIIAASGLDYRVIMLSRFARYGESVYGTYFPICIGAPLGNDACTNATTPFELTPPFYPYSNDSESEDAWCDVLASFSQPDEFAPADEARAWPTLSPQGWSSWLREDAFKSFLVFTDDEVKCSWGGNSWRDRDSASRGTAIAAEFDAELLALSPSQFGTAADRRYVWHSIVGMVGNSSGGSVAPWMPADSIRTSRCGGGADAPGTGHQALSRLTGGLRYPICDTGAFAQIFQEVAEAVVDTSLTPCQYEVESAGSFAIAHSEVTVRSVDAASGSESSLSLNQVSNAAGCAADSYYFDDPLNPTAVLLCPTTCSSVQATVGQEVQVLVELGCDRGATVTYTETYEAGCASGTHPVWTMVTYDSTTVDDGTIEFSVRSGMDAVELASKSFALAHTVTAANSSCGLSCAPQLDQTLSESEWSDEFLELQIAINPSSNGESPELNQWEVRYSCQDGE